MSQQNRPEGEAPRARREGNPVSAPGRPTGTGGGSGHEVPNARRRGCVAALLAMTGAALPSPSAAAAVGLPAAALKGRVSVEAALQSRRSVRQYADRPLALGELGQLLWSAQGVSSAAGLRTAPSAGALYSLEVYVAAGAVENLAPGVYHYQPRGHTLAAGTPGDVRTELAAAALGQPWVARAPATLLLAAVFDRTRRRYGDRGTMYVQMEAGHAAQNVLLQAVALGLAGVPVGAFDDRRVARVMSLLAGEQPLYLLPVGRPR
jgi:SagB-type dehydrogenase family enzyme